MNISDNLFNCVVEFGNEHQKCYIDKKNNINIGDSQEISSNQKEVSTTQLRKLSTELNSRLNGSFENKSLLQITNFQTNMLNLNRKIEKWNKKVDDNFILSLINSIFNIKVNTINTNHIGIKLGEKRIEQAEIEKREVVVQAETRLSLKPIEEYYQSEISSIINTLASTTESQFATPPVPWYDTVPASEQIAFNHPIHSKYLQSRCFQVHHYVNSITLLCHLLRTPALKEQLPLMHEKTFFWHLFGRDLCYHLRDLCYHLSDRKMDTEDVRAFALLVNINPEWLIPHAENNNWRSFIEVCFCNRPVVAATHVT